ncbi:MAG: sulfotransferase [Alphaproteobacteria bacterium]|nr:sulfotransferase [Alphaproteobacteria bacterium]
MPRDLDADAIAARVAQQTGRPVPVPEGMRVLLDDARHAGLTAVGELVLATTCQRMLERRASIEQDCRTRPDISGRAPRRPIVITGLHRTGTTTLQRLLALDPRARSLPFWMVQDTRPVLPARRWPLRVMGRRLRGALDSLAWTVLSPNMRRVHRIPPGAPEEELDFLLTTFDSPALWYRTPAHGFLDWALHRDQSPAYRLLRLRLTHLEEVVSGDHWVLKCPTHLLSFDALLDTFPDAHVVVTHRDPAKAIPSFLGLVEVLHEASHRDPRSAATVHNGVRLCVASIDRMMEARARRSDEHRITDLSFERMVQDPISAVHDLYERLGMDRDPAHDRAMQRWLARRRSDGERRGHDPERYGLTSDGLRGALADYIDRYGIAVRGRRAA